MLGTGLGPTDAWDFSRVPRALATATRTDTPALGDPLRRWPRGTAASTERRPKALGRGAPDHPKVTEHWQKWLITGTELG
jgi:hypothetical protein